MANTQFESEYALENAEAMLDACRQEFATAGRADAVEALNGLDVTSPASAHIALLTVQNLPALGDMEAVKRATVDALRSAHRQLLQRTQARAS